MCDIDHFKQINDAHGHIAGDEVLQQFAALAQKPIRGNSDWMARYGGEEFIIVLPETGYAGAVAVAEKIRARIGATPFATRTGDIVVTTSFGVASTGPNGPDILLKVDALIRIADECLYRSKLEGRDRTSGSEIAVCRPLVAHG
jgi:two-component system cell cycle response regulator